MPARAVFPLMLIRSAGLPLAVLESLATYWQTAEEALLVGEKRRTAATMALQQALDKALSALPGSPQRTAVYNARKAFFQRQKLPDTRQVTAWSAPGHIPEIAGLPAAIHSFQAAEDEAQIAQTAYRQQYEQALHAGYRALQEIAGLENFQRALLFSSHSLLEQLPHLIQTPAEQFTKKERQTALTVLQYVARMATKTSPLSRFTTVSVQKISADAKPPEQEDWQSSISKTAVTPNVALLEAIYAVLLAEPVFYRSLTICLNPCIVSLSKENYHWLFFNGEQERFQTAEPTPMLHLVVETLLENRRQMPFPTLLKQLTPAVDASPGALEKYMLELAGLGFLEWVLPESGLSASWCGNLYQYLGFLPAEPLIVSTAALLQWLRTAARTLPFQSVAEALDTQRQTLEQLRQYFARFDAAPPPIPAEQLFFEDVEQAVSVSFPSETLSGLLHQLADAWTQRPDKPLPENRAALNALLDEFCPEGNAIDFLRFAGLYLGRETASGDGAGAAKGSPVVCDARLADDRIGGLFQVYREKKQWYAVVNALYPGGGKMFARWLHLFPANVKEELEHWISTPKIRNPKSEIRNPKSEIRNQVSPIPFPWQGWFNANFQPPLGLNQLAVPGGRTKPAPGEQAFLLGNLDLVKTVSSPLLRDRVSGTCFHLNDLGLEAPETRPPVMQLLWNAGVPYQSKDALLPEGLWQPLYDGNIRYRARHTYRNLVVARAAWALGPAVWQSWLTKGIEPVDFFVNVRQALTALGVPRRFFARFAGENPQYFDQNSPVLILLFQKQLQRHGGALFLTEMLPQPDQAVVELNGKCAAEFVMEFAI